MNSVAILEISPILETRDHPFLRELIRQFRQQDSRSLYRNWSDEELLQSLVHSTSRQKNPSLTELGILAFYHAITTEIEKETGKLPETFINFSHQGIGSVVISCGYLLVLIETFQKVGNFGFNSLESLIDKAEELIFYSLNKISKFF